MPPDVLADLASELASSNMHQLVLGTVALVPNAKLACTMNVFDEIHMCLDHFESLLMLACMPLQAFNIS